MVNSGRMIPMQSRQNVRPSASRCQVSEPCMFMQCVSYISRCTGCQNPVSHAFDCVQRGAVAADAAADDHKVVVVVLAAMGCCPNQDRSPRGSQWSRPPAQDNAARILNLRGSHARWRWRVQAGQPQLKAENSQRALVWGSAIGCDEGRRRDSELRCKADAGIRHLHSVCSHAWPGRHSPTPANDLIEAGCAVAAR